MRFLGAAAALAAISDAFLLPPNVSPNDNELINTLPVENIVEADGRTMELPCRGCSVNVHDLDGKMHTVDTTSSLQLKFVVDHNTPDDRLFLNGLQIYPLDTHSKSFMDALTAPQMIDSSPFEVAKPKLGYSLQIQPRPHSDKDQLDLVSITLEIVEVGGKFVDGIPSVELELLRMPSNKLIIADVNVSSPADAGKECTNIVCKLRAIVADRLSKLKGGCSKSRPSGAAGSHSSRPRPHHQGGHPRPHGPHRTHHRHRHHTLARFLRSVVLHILIPITVGVVAGVTASLVGMAVGHLAIFIWRALFRRGGKGAYSKVQHEDVSVEEGDDESKSFLEHQSAPPSYEEAAVEEKASE
jgi:hypothetical protein